MKLQGKNTKDKYKITAMHKKNPLTGPKRVGESRHRNMGPGIAKACNKIYKYTKEKTV